MYLGYGVVLNLEGKKKKKKGNLSVRKKRAKEKKKICCFTSTKEVKKERAKWNSNLTKPAVISYSYKQMPHWRKWGKTNSYKFNLRVKIHWDN